MRLLENHSLLQYNTFGLAVKARYFGEFNSEEELQKYLHHAKQHSLIFLPVGRGSNLLFLNDFDGLVLHSGISYIRVIEDNADDVLLEVGSGVIWDELVDYCVEQEWWGIENLTSIPGETGAAAVQNIGAYSVELVDVLVSVKAVDLLDGSVHTFAAHECGYGYRVSKFKQEWKGRYMITSVKMRLSKHPIHRLDYQHLNAEVLKQGSITLPNIRNTIRTIRNEKLPDPKVLGNAGSFFMNPSISKDVFELLLSEYPQMPHYPLPNDEVKVPAGWLIEHCGWKGKRIGNVGVHEKQALVIVNYGGAKAGEIVDLATQIQASVKAKFGIELVPEVIYIG